MVLCLTASGHQMVRVLRPPIHTDSSSTLGSDQTTNTNGLVINSTPFLLLSSVTPFTGDDVLEATGQDLKAPISRWTPQHANPTPRLFSQGSNIQIGDGGGKVSVNSQMGFLHPQNRSKCSKLLVYLLSAIIIITIIIIIIVTRIYNWRHNTALLLQGRFTIK